MRSKPIPATDLDRVLAYHQITKHAPQRYARALGYMDWDTQPDPFRFFRGAPRVELPLCADDLGTSYLDLYRPGAVAPKALDLASLATFFELALGLTAWKEFGNARWSLRADPSSGNLHPTEAYGILSAVPEQGGAGVALPAGVHHYNAHDHCLEQRAQPAAGAAAQLAELLPPDAFLVVVTSIHWRESWKYGERAYRYCQHDAGHVLATLRYAAAALGWSARLVEGLGGVVLGRLAGTDRDADYAGLDALDREHPDYALVVAPRDVQGAAERVRAKAAELANLVAACVWSGRANELSSEHHEWDVIDAVAQATREPAGGGAGQPSWTPVAARVEAVLPDPTVTAATLIRQRRSAVAMDGKTTLPAASFYAMLDRLLPRPHTAPLDALPWEARIHLALFVNRVVGLAPGLYLFERNEHVHAAFRAQLGRAPRWTRPAGCPDHLRLWCISERDLRGTAAAISCQQAIAGDGAFSLGMLAEYRAVLAAGAHGYPRLFWEAGVVGQVLYLEAEAYGLRGTGIGCYFDDMLHQALGLEDDTFQDLYHFTLGGPLEDERLGTHPPYAHLARAPR